jgi:hypothetical protein
VSSEACSGTVLPTRKGGVLLVHVVSIRLAMTGHGTEQKPLSAPGVTTVRENLPTLRRIPIGCPRRVRQVHFLSLVVAACLLLYNFRSPRWFNYDEWDFLANRGVHLFGGNGILYPHNEHWSTIPILIWRALFSLVGVHDYWLYAVPLIVAHLVCAHLLWRLMLRHDIDYWVATLLAATFLVLGIGWENLTWAFQIGFVGSLAFGLLSIEAVEDDNFVFPAVWGTCALMCSGMGVPMVIASGLVALARRRPRLAVAATAPPAAIYILWWHFIASFSEHPLFGTLPSFVWNGLTFSVSSYLDLPRIGGIAVVLLLALAAVWWRDVPAALAVATIFTYGFIGLGRVDPTQSRYSYFAIALLIPLFGRIITLIIRQRNMRPVVLTGLCVLVALNVIKLQSTVGELNSVSNAEESSINAAAYLINDGHQFPKDALTYYTPWMHRQEALTVASLTTMIARNQFSVPSHVAPATLRAERIALNVFASRERANGATSAVPPSSASGCQPLTYSPSVRINLSAPASVRLENSHFSTGIPSEPPSVLVELIPATGGPLVFTDAFIYSGDQWLNLPGGEARTAILSALYGSVSVC